MSTRRDLIADYFRRQYDSHEGSTEENVAALFAEDLVFHLTEGKTMGLDELVIVCDLLRRTRHNSKTLVSDYKEDGDNVSFILYIVGTDPITGHAAAVSTRTEYGFRGDKVAIVRQEDPAGVENAVRAAGVRLG